MLGLVWHKPQMCGAEEQIRLGLERDPCRKHAKNRPVLGVGPSVIEKALKSFKQGRYNQMNIRKALFWLTKHRGQRVGGIKSNLHFPSCLSLIHI